MSKSWRGWVPGFPSASAGAEVSPKQWELGRFVDRVFASAGPRCLFLVTFSFSLKLEQVS